MKKLALLTMGLLSLAVFAAGSLRADSPTAAGARKWQTNSVSPAQISGGFKLREVLLSTKTAVILVSTDNARYEMWVQNTSTWNVQIAIATSNVTVGFDTKTAFASMGNSNSIILEVATTTLLNQWGVPASTLYLGKNFLQYYGPIWGIANGSSTVKNDEWLGRVKVFEQQLQSEGQ